MTKTKQTARADWRRVSGLEDLKKKGKLKIRVDGRQIALFHHASGVFACNNNCPHEGYPLIEGHTSENCMLTCNWHNWKFDLRDGSNLFGGDRLRTYAVEIRGDEIWLDISDPPVETRRAQILQNLHDAFDDYSYDRIAREIARWLKLDSDPMEILRQAIIWSWSKMEFGWTHAYAGMADWLELYHEHADNREIQLACLTEAVSHVAYDVLREKEYDFEAGILPYNNEAFLQAIESENESDAIAMVRGGLRDGLGFEDFEAALSEAALKHYNDFGHSLIYVTKLGTLVGKLGDQILKPLLQSLVRSLVYATREDRIPEFRRYQTALKQWSENGTTRPSPDNWKGQGIDRSLEVVLECSGSSPEEIYQSLLTANARNLLNFDIRQQDKIRISVSGNVGWLDFTHGLTFANAVRTQCTRFPHLWPSGLLQMACFNGRNASYTKDEQNVDDWIKSPVDGELSQMLSTVLDHGQGEHIVSVHLLKTALAVRDENRQLDESDRRLLTASLKRFFHSPLKRRQSLRTAYQSLKFVERE